jgi:hypothetical protein
VRTLRAAGVRQKRVRRLRRNVASLRVLLTRLRAPLSAAALRARSTYTLESYERLANEFAARRFGAGGAPAPGVVEVRQRTRVTCQPCSRCFARDARCAARALAALRWRALACMRRQAARCAADTPLHHRARARCAARHDTR